MKFPVPAYVVSACLAVLVLVPGCATPTSVVPLTIPLAYKTVAEPGDFPTLPPCAAISEVEVTDMRADKSLGRRFVNDNAATTAPVTSGSDIAGWIRSGTLEVLKRSGVSLGKSGAPVLRIAVELIRTNENVVHRSGYDARIVLSGRLAKSAGAPACWTDRASGASENYGYSGSVENYQETLNHALDRAVLGLINGPRFGQEVCACGNR